jgi:hypothetical protein
MTKHASQKDKHGQRGSDKTVVDSFSASDRPAPSGITGVRRDHRRVAQPDLTARPAAHKRGHGERPRGQPTWGRHATETAHSWDGKERSAA